jgi:hypothetical protein
MRLTREGRSHERLLLFGALLMLAGCQNWPASGRQRRAARGAGSRFEIVFGQAPFCKELAFCSTEEGSSPCNS